MIFTYNLTNNKGLGIAGLLILLCTSVKSKYLPKQRGTATGSGKTDSWTLCHFFWMRMSLSLFRHFLICFSKIKTPKLTHNIGNAVQLNRLT